MLKPPILDRREFLLAASAPVLSACSLPGASSGTREWRLVAAPARHAVRGDAHPAVDAWAYNGVVPGPVLRARQGERLRVEFENRLTQPSTIHWHGLRLPNAMDGVPGVTQAAVAPQGRFTYAFDLPDAGTFWYHPHWRSSEQLDRGLHGLLIVDEPEPPAVDRDLAWVLDDWRLTQGGAISETFGSPRDIAHAGRIGNAITVNGRPPQDLRVRPNERIRLRLVNVANARIFALHFEGPQPRIIALDGQPVRPHLPPGGRIVLAPGMRCDLLLDATGSAGERHAVFDTFYPRQAFDLLHLAYDGPPMRAAPRGPVPVLPSNPLAEPDLAQAVTHALRFEGGMMGGMHRATLNGESLPMMSLMRQGKAWAINGVVSSGHGEGGHAGHGAQDAPVLSLERGRSYVLAMVNDSRWHHPIHLHGHHFRVIRRNGRPTEHREWRDTVLMDPGERVDIAFVADNPGDWMLHCHVLEHQDGGMMGVFRVA